MAEYPSVYRHSMAVALERGEMDAWRSSRQANIACKQAIEATIREHFDGMHLAPGCVQAILREFGYLRTAYVLSNTLQEKDFDGRFSRLNRAWFEQIKVPEDRNNFDFVVESHPAVLDGFMQGFRTQCQRTEYVPTEAEPTQTIPADQSQPQSQNYTM